MHTSVSGGGVNKRIKQIPIAYFSGTAQKKKFQTGVRNRIKALKNKAFGLFGSGTFA
ncbi:hypothetical protein ACFPU0_17950 [Pseudomonas sp. GCM10022186]|uniref:hypothetical protein n=1 Tax=Pseudomonas sp. GCM10022186 TaxID=3252650 RepID=UPI0036126B5E